MTQTVSVNQFEGPLGLLLELVERNKMPVTDIAVATITAEYLERIAHLEHLAASELAEFLQLGSRLVYIKSLALLPNTPPDEQITELRQLSSELADYQRYQSAAKVLAERAKHPTWSRPATAQLAAHDLPLPSLTLSELAAAFQSALKRLEPAPAKQAIASELSQADIMKRLRQQLAHGPLNLDDLLAGLTDRLEMVVTFSALLELIRDGKSRVVQTHQFAPITVEMA